MLQLIPALLLILLQSGAEPDVARVRSHALSLMMGVQVRAEMPADIDRAVGESLSDVQIQVLLGILADDSAPQVHEAEFGPSEPCAALDEPLPISAPVSSIRSRDGPASF